MTISTSPITDSYMVLPGLFAGAYPINRWDSEDQNLALLIDAGIRSLINLTEAGEGQDYAPLLQEIARKKGIQVNLARMPIRDFSVPTREEMQAILNWMDEELARGRSLYVHCYGGRGRTGMVIGCYLVRHGLSGQQALDRIAELRRGIPSSRWPSPETWEQRNYVESWVE